MTNGSANVFNDAAAYEAYMGRWSRLVGRNFVNWLDISPDRVWLDVGAGTGILTRVILDIASPKKIVALDLSQQYLDYARQALVDDRVEFRVGNASQMAVEAPAYDVAVAGLVLNFVPSPEEAVRGMQAAVVPGGVVAAYVWDYTDRMEMMRSFWDAAAAVDPSAGGETSGAQYAICNPQRLQALFESAGLRHVEVTAIDVEAKFVNFDDFWLPFLGAQGSISKYLRSLDDGRRSAMRAYLLDTLPINNDQTIPLNAGAWAVKGLR